jgi:hypothetical protein
LPNNAASIPISPLRLQINVIWWANTCGGPATLRIACTVLLIPAN